MVFGGGGRPVIHDTQQVWPACGLKSCSSPPPKHTYTYTHWRVFAWITVLWKHVLFQDEGPWRTGQDPGERAEVLLCTGGRLPSQQVWFEDDGVLWSKPLTDPFFLFVFLLYLLFDLLRNTNITFNIQSAVSAKCRDTRVEELWGLTSFFGYSTQTFVRAVNLFDRYLTLTKVRQLTIPQEIKGTQIIHPRVKLIRCKPFEPIIKSHFSMSYKWEKKLTPANVDLFIFLNQKFWKHNSVSGSFRQHCSIMIYFTSNITFWAALQMEKKKLCTVNI